MKEWRLEAFDFSFYFTTDIKKLKTQKFLNYQEELKDTSKPMSNRAILEWNSRREG